MIVAPSSSSGHFLCVHSFFLPRSRVNPLIQQLLRLKCEAYSTLNEEDEDPASESRINEMFGMTHLQAPRALLDPAALYLTAILEYVSVHVNYAFANYSRYRSLCEYVYSDVNIPFSP
jgi:hypothetical protein